MERRRVLVTGATGLHRRSAGPRAAPCRVRRALPGPVAGEARRPPVDRRRRGGARATSSTPRRWPTAMAGVDAAYYLVHSMGATSAFAERDRRSATAFRDAAGDAPASRRSSTSVGSATTTPKRVSEHLEQPSRRRRGAGRRSGAGHRAARRGDHRIGERQLRDAAPPHRRAAGDDHAALGADALPADRDPRCARVPRRRAG